MKRRSSSLLFVVLCGLAPAVLGNLVHWSALLLGSSMVTASGSLLLVMTVLGGGRASTDPYGSRNPSRPPHRRSSPSQETR